MAPSSLGSAWSPRSGTGELQSQGDFGEHDGSWANCIVQPAAAEALACKESMNHALCLLLLLILFVLPPILPSSLLSLSLSVSLSLSLSFFLPADRPATRSAFSASLPGLIHVEAQQCRQNRNAIITGHSLIRLELI